MSEMRGERGERGERDTTAILRRRLQDGKHYLTRTAGITRDSGLVLGHGRGLRRGQGGDGNGGIYNMYCTWWAAPTINCLRCTLHVHDGLT